VLKVHYVLQLFKKAQARGVDVYQDSRARIVLIKQVSSGCVMS